MMHWCVCTRATTRRTTSAAGLGALDPAGVPHLTSCSNLFSSSLYLKRTGDLDSLLSTLMISALSRWVHTLVAAGSRSTRVYPR